MFGEAMLGCSGQNDGSNRMRTIWKRLLEFTETYENPWLQYSALAINGHSTGSHFLHVLAVVSGGGLRESLQLFSVQ